MSRDYDDPLARKKKAKLPSELVLLVRELKLFIIITILELRVAIVGALVLMETDGAVRVNIVISLEGCRLAKRVVMSLSGGVALGGVNVLLVKRALHGREWRGDVRRRKGGKEGRDAVSERKKVDTRRRCPIQTARERE